MIFLLQLEQLPLCTHIVEPQFEHVHLIFSFLINFLIPNLFIFSRFSIMLMLYLVRYLLSMCFILSHGNSQHMKQYFRLFFFSVLQVLILQFKMVFGTGPFSLIFLHPEHLFFSLRYAMHIPQFIPHGAIIEDLNDIVLSNIFTGLFLIQAEA